MEQGTGGWLLWRKKGIGSSDAAAIMGVSPWKTPYQLWEEKLGLREPEVTNFAMARGNELEPVARHRYELLTGIDMPPAVMTNKDNEVFRASLDGYNAEISRVLEIKCPGKEDHEKAVNGVIPDKYYPQLQWQLLVTGAKEAHYFSFDGENVALVEVPRDEKYITDMVSKASHFWDLVKNSVPPPFSDRDVVEIKDPMMCSLGEKWKVCKAMFDEAEKRLADIRLEIIERVKTQSHPRVIFGGVKVTKTVAKGAVDYKKIADQVGYDPDAYRNKPTVRYTVTG